VAERSASDPPRAEPVTSPRAEAGPQHGKLRLPWQKITVPQELSLRELQTYQREIHDRFARQWRRPYHLAYAGRELVSTVRFRINRNGRISNVALVRGSGNKEMDRSVLQAAKTVRAVSPIPKNARSDYYDIMVEFALTPVKRD
jgi:TonB family protein